MTHVEEDVAFFYEIGITIAVWSQVETSLFEVVARCVLPNERKALGNAFFSIENFRSKLGFADAFIESTFAGNPHLLDWQSIFEQLTKASRQRNKIAHNRRMVFPNGTQGRRFAIVPWTIGEPGPVSKNKRPPQGSLCLRDIVGIRYEFYALHLALNRLALEIVGQIALHPKPGELVMDLPTIRQIKNRIHEALGHPQKPSRRK